MKTIEKVKEFSKLFEQAWSETPTVPSSKVGLLRLQLISEEIGELTHALAASDPLETLDALVDIQYVLDGTYGAYGLESSYHAEEVPTEMNMAWGELPRHTQMELLGDMHQALSRISWKMGDVHNTEVEDAPETYLRQLAVELGCLNSILQLAFNSLGFSEVRDAAFSEVHQSNLSKLGEDGKRIINEAGRVVKGPNYFKPDLSGFVEGMK